MVSLADKKVDVYSYAITMYEVLTESQAWKDESKDLIVPNVIMGVRPVIPEAKLKEYESYPSMLDVILIGWDGNPDRRPLFHEILDMISRDFYSLSRNPETTSSSLMGPRLPQ